MSNFQNVVYVYSDSVDNSEALKKVVMLTQKNQAELTILFTMTDDPLPDSLSFAKEKVDELAAKKETKRKEIVAELASSQVIKRDSIYSNSYTEVIKKVKEYSFDLIVKPTENEGVLGKVFGSNDMGYLRKSPCPVWLINTLPKRIPEPLLRLLMSAIMPLMQKNW